ncbi:hypothetical protein AK812_SmicGene45334, partial [Symbiodinium microadriaticum]
DRHRFNPHLLLELRPGSVGAGPQFLNRGLSFPRRQEAELAFTLSGRSALVSLAEVQREAGSPVSDRQIDIVCVSHRWEAREHPDPCRLLGDEAEYFDLACSDWSRARVLEPARAGCIRLSVYSRNALGLYTSEQDPSEVGLVEP